MQQRNLALDIQWVATDWMEKHGADQASRGKFRCPEFSLGPKGINRLRKFESNPLWDVFGSKATSGWADIYTAFDILQDDHNCIQNLGPWEGVRNPGQRQELRFIMVPKFQILAVLNILRHSKLASVILAIPVSMVGFLENLVQVKEYRKLSVSKEQGVFNKRSVDAWLLAKIEGRC